MSSVTPYSFQFQPSTPTPSSSIETQNSLPTKPSLFPFQFPLAASEQAFVYNNQSPVASATNEFKPKGLNKINVKPGGHLFNYLETLKTRLPSDQAQTLSKLMTNIQVTLSH